MNKLRIAQIHYEQLKSHLFPGDGLEAVAVALCGRNHHKGSDTLMVMELLLIPYDRCDTRTPIRVSWPTELINPLIAKAQTDNLAIVKFHCHPGGGDNFSEYDDKSDAELFEHLFAWLQNDLPHGSCVLLPDGRIFGRFFRPDLQPEPIQLISVAGPQFLDWFYDEVTGIDETMHKRNLQAFGKGTIERLKRLKIGVVGCSGTGSPVIEQLKRLGAGNLVIVDPDYIDFHNLNRILGSTKEDAMSKAKKTVVAAREIEKVGFGTNVEAFADDIVSREVVMALAHCDILIGCVDGPEGRHVLNLVSTFYLIPFIDVGVKLDADGKGNIDAIYGSVHVVLPGGSSLLSRGQYSLEELQAASIKRSSPEEYHRNEYLAKVDEDTPAVVTVNMLVAAYAANELLARLHSYRFIDAGEIDVIRIHFNLLKVFTEAAPVKCEFFSRYLGWGDRQPLLNLIELGS